MAEQYERTVAFPAARSLLQEKGSGAFARLMVEGSAVRMMAAPRLHEAMLAAMDYVQHMGEEPDAGPQDATRWNHNEPSPERQEDVDGRYRCAIDSAESPLFHRWCSQEGCVSLMGEANDVALLAAKRQRGMETFVPPMPSSTVPHQWEICVTHSRRRRLIKLMSVL